MKAQRSRHKWLVAVVGAAALAAAACSSSTTTSTPSTDSSKTPSAELSAAHAAVVAGMKTPTTITQTQPLPHTPPRGKLVVCTADDDIPSDYTICTEGVEVAAKAVGWKYESDYFDPSNPASVDAALNSALAKHPAAVINVGGQLESQYDQTTLKKFASAGVPIVATNVASLTPTKTLIGPVNSAADSVTGGTLLAKWVIDNSHGDGKALIVDVPAYSELNQVDLTMTSVLTKDCPGCSVKTLDLTLPEVAAGQIISSTVSALKANPQYHYVFFVTSSFGDGITSALKAAGLNDVMVGGQDMDPEGAAALQDGTEAVQTGGPAIPYLGFMSMDLALRHYETGATSSVGDYTAPIQLMTPANIGHISIWDSPATALQQFEKLWKVKG